MTNEQAIKWLKDYIQNTPFQMEQYERAFEMAIQALSQEPCDDVVSRDAALIIAGTHTLTVDETVKAIKNLPPVTQKSKTGRWVEETKRECVFSIKDEDYECRKYGNVIYLHCSNCGWKTGSQANDFNYCPNCGCRMVEPQEKRCEDCNHYGKLSLDCARCDDDCSMYEPQESEVRNE